MGNGNFLQKRIGAKLAGVGNLSKILAVQTFSANGLEITPEQFTVLSALYENDGLYQRQLSALTLKDRPNISRILTILENMGYITKTPDVMGRKVFKLAVTEKGEIAYHAILPIITKVWEDTIKDIPAQDLEIFNKTLLKIKQNLLSKVNIQI